MGDIAIRIENVSKHYYLGLKKSRSLRDSFSDKLQWLLKKQSPIDERIFWALKDINFEVKKGEVLGIIGKNGAGKSTLLKILSRITAPSSGRIEMNGRIGSLLEVGTGFHPELTGRENIFMNGSILGMKRAEIRQKFDEIVSFSGVEQFIDTPVKRYSSGMYVRLAFAVAAHLDPEILIIDEVLAVGDVEFQKKCLGKIKDIAGEGRTVLFVSHNMEAAKKLCTQGILIKQGIIEAKDHIDNVIRLYLNNFIKESYLKQWNYAEAPGNYHAKLLKASVNKDGNDNQPLSQKDSFTLNFEFAYLENKKTQIDITYHLIDERGTLVYVGSTGFIEEDHYFEKSLIKGTCYFPGGLLNEGTYIISRLLLVSNRTEILFEYNDLLSFEIIEVNTGKLGWTGGKEGVIKPDNVKWNLTSENL